MPAPMRIQNCKQRASSSMNAMRPTCACGGSTCRPGWPEPAQPRLADLQLAVPGGHAAHIARSGVAEGEQPQRPLHCRQPPPLLGRRYRLQQQRLYLLRRASCPRRESSLPSGLQPFVGLPEHLSAHSAATGCSCASGTLPATPLPPLSQARTEHVLEEAWDGGGLVSLMAEWQIPIKACS